tara:strand:- start:663 stop:974 length:312 start_codon:yes stop_codon:yes gene_type:complete
LRKSVKPLADSSISIKAGNRFSQPERDLRGILRVSLGEGFESSEGNSMDPVAGMEQTLTSILVMPRTNAMRPTCKWPYMVIGDMGDRLKSAGQYIQYSSQRPP